MSVTFSANFGSLESLNLRVKCGFKPASAQMRCTLVWLMPISLAMARTLQCVALAGVSFAVFVSTFSFTSAVSGFLRAGRVLSRRRPSTPSAT